MDDISAEIWSGFLWHRSLKYYRYTNLHGKCCAAPFHDMLISGALEYTYNDGSPNIFT
jgi:hypothetical protein